MKEFRAPAARMELVSYATPYCGVLPSNETRVDFAAYHEFAGNTGVLSFARPRFRHLAAHLHNSCQECCQAWS